MGDAHRGAGQLQEALEAYRLATRLAPQFGVYHARQADVLVRLGSAQEGLDEALMAVALAPTQWESWLSLGRAYADLAADDGGQAAAAESALRECRITLNRNSLPDDPNGPWYTSGLRLGTPAATTRGMGPDAMKEVAQVVNRVLRATRPTTAKSGAPSKAKYTIEPAVADEARSRIGAVLDQHPLYPELGDAS